MKFASNFNPVWTFIKTLRKFQKVRDVEYIKGQALPPKRKKYESVDDCIQGVVRVMDYKNRIAIGSCGEYDGEKLCGEEVEKPAGNRPR